MLQIQFDTLYVFLIVFIYFYGFRKGLSQFLIGLWLLDAWVIPLLVLNPVFQSLLK